MILFDVKIDKESIIISNYWLCEMIAKEQEISLYEFYKKYLDKRKPFWILCFLQTNEKIDSRLYKKLEKEILSLDEISLRMDKFKEITNLSEEDICFIINYYLSELSPENIEDYKLRNIYEYNQNMEAISKLLKNHKDKYIHLSDGRNEYIKVKDECNYINEKWDNLYLTLENEDEKNEITELIYSLEELAENDINKNIVKRLKILLKNQLDLEF